jgi:hypothetical protein
MTGYLQMLMIIALRTEKAHNSLIMSELPPTKSLIIKQLRAFFAYLPDIQPVGKTGNFAVPVQLKIKNNEISRYLQDFNKHTPLRFAHPPLYKRGDYGNLQTCTNNESSEFSPFLKGRCPKDRGVDRGAYARQVSIKAL